MSSVPLNSRSRSLGFAERTKKNLLFIEAAFSEGADVHVVAQVILSLLGLVVFPWERHFKTRMDDVPLDDLYKEGWPQWNIAVGSSGTLSELVRPLRNATAHGRLTFSSESRLLHEVEISFWDCQWGAAPHWEASINGSDLHEFCLRFTDLVEDVLR